MVFDQRGEGSKGVTMKLLKKNALQAEHSQLGVGGWHGSCIARMPMSQGQIEKRVVEDEVTEVWKVWVMDFGFYSERNEGESDLSIFTNMVT